MQGEWWAFIHCFFFVRLAALFGSLLHYMLLALVGNGWASLCIGPIRNSSLAQLHTQTGERYVCPFWECDVKLVVGRFAKDE